MLTISSLPPELTRILFDAGSRIVVLVEGDADRDVLREWFEAERVEIEFFECGGIAPLTNLLNEFITRGTLKRAYGITDRDFRSEEEVEASYSEGSSGIAGKSKSSWSIPARCRKLLRFFWQFPKSHAETSHQFILRRYALENYLLEPKPLREVLRVRYPEIIKELPTEQAMAEQLLERCQRLKSIMAANWVFFDTSQNSQGTDPEYFSVGYETNRDTVIQQAAKRLKCSESEAEGLILEKEQLLEKSLSQLETAHRVIDGKRLLHWIQREQFKTSGGDDYLRRLLTREAKAHNLPADIIHIVRERIIAQSRK